MYVLASDIPDHVHVQTMISRITIMTLTAGEFSNRRSTVGSEPIARLDTPMQAWSGGWMAAVGERKSGGYTENANLRTAAAAACGTSDNRRARAHT